MSTSTQKEVYITWKRKEKKKVTNHKDIKTQKTDCLVLSKFSMIAIALRC